MWRKAAAKEWGLEGAADLNFTAKEKTALRQMKQMGGQTATGKGLGKAGAKRFGRLLKRAIQDQEEPAGKGQVSLPKTPVRLFKHQIQTKADSTQNNATQTKASSTHVSQLILTMVSKCKHRGGISMAELKQTLAAEGYDVKKNNRQVNVVTRRLVNNETLIRTTRNTTYRLNRKTDTVCVRTDAVKTQKPTGDLKQSKTVTKSPKAAEKPQRQAVNTPKPRDKSHKPKGKTSRQAAKSKKSKVKARKPAGRSHESRRKTPKTRRKPSKPAGKKRRAQTNQAARSRKAPRKAQRTRKRQLKRKRRPYKSSQKKRQLTRRKLPKTRSRVKTRQRQKTKRRTYYK